MASANKDVIDDSSASTNIGYDLSLFEDKDSAREYLCFLCRRVCRDAVELWCGEELSDDDHDVLFCKECLSSHFTSRRKENQSLCPINERHQNSHFNAARNIRKQINKLVVCCHRRECEWKGPLSEWRNHCKSCNVDRPFCKICDLIIDENTVNEHNQSHLSRHIFILHSKLEAISISKSLHSMPRNDGEIKTTIIDAVKRNEERLKAMEQRIESLNEENHRLRVNAEAQSIEIQELRSIITSMSALQKIQGPPSKVDREISIDLKAMNDDEKSNEQIDSIKNPLKLRSDGQRASYRIGDHGDAVIATTDLDTDDEAKCTRFLDSASALMRAETVPYSESETETETVDEALTQHGDVTKSRRVLPAPPLRIRNRSGNLNLSNLSLRSLTPLSSSPGTMSRQNSTRYFHPEGIELYHPQSMKYQMYHPQRAVKVRVIKPGGGGMKWRSRFMCCGAAMDENVYLMDVLEIKDGDKKKRRKSEGALSSKKRRRSQPNSTQYVVVGPDETDKLPKKWRKNMHSGCKRKKESGIFLCCNKPRGSVGCRKRYKCCKQDVAECRGSHMRTTSGCKIGWGC